MASSTTSTSIGNGDVFATDSTKSTIYKITVAQVAAGTGTPEAIDVSSGITSTPGQFNLNGIVARGHELIVVNSFTGELVRITFAGDDNDRGDHNKRAGAARAAGTPTITKIDLGAATVKNGDGLLMDCGRVLVVRGTNGAPPRRRVSRRTARTA